MPTLLAIDAATDACSVALYQAGRVSEDFRLLPKSHTQFLLPMVDEQLASGGLNLADIDAIAFTAGPGSFTGLRVACAMVQGLAFAADIPVIPVSTLQVMAQYATVDLSLAQGELIVPVLDARMAEVYWAAFEVSDGTAVRRRDDTLAAPGNVQLGDYQGQSIYGVGDGWQFASEFSGVGPGTRVQQSLLPHASAALPFALKCWERGEVLAAELAQPTYLRDSVAWQKS